ncbi:18S rRNA maturation protein [Aspergillus fumigatus]|nr:18S rRNA maturation protein [Aspergillus fumigatus]KAH1409152.1 18S rRNA maturation protein [Aspergillus fumigatus]KAH1415701.1 18S rRNA maturation protein [Aspergillus fumigatus]KAH1574034.1 18S rRNA maturation protein [Aspergillus fumigatus]KAH1598172.1 18S rRNA maturation protein [Aspergillus fumigatus]
MPREFSREKRAHSDSTTTSKRKYHEGSEDSQPAKKKKVHPPKHEHNYPSVNELKKRIRDVKRLLNRVDLPADARIVQERALAGYEKDLEDELARRHRSQMIKKYHFVRFLDRKAASKDLKRLLRREQEISNSDLDPAAKKEKLAALAGKIHAAQVNHNYTIYYPLTQKYVALYAEQKKKKKESSAQSEKPSEPEAEVASKLIYDTTGERPPMWRVVEKCMEDGTLDLLREGKLDGSEKGEKSSQAPEQKKSKKSTDDDQYARNKSSTEKVSDKPSGKSRKSGGKQDRKAKRSAAMEGAYWSANEHDDDDIESDGGFFEA